MRGRPTVNYESWNWGGFDITDCDTGFGGGNAYKAYVNTPGMLDVVLTSTRAIYKAPIGAVSYTHLTLPTSDLV